MVDQCSKCKYPLYDSVQRRGVRKFSCGHGFHESCMSNTTDKCPICRAIEVGVKIAVYAGSAIIGAVLAPVVAPVALGIVGFSAAGPVAGTLAAAWQGTIGNVVAGSLFSVCQSVAMGGALPAVGFVAGAAASAGAAGAAMAENVSFRQGTEATEGSEKDDDGKL